jgi:hypothetical protein
MREDGFDCCNGKAIVWVNDIVPNGIDIHSTNVGEGLQVPCPENLQINHYGVMSKEYFKRAKQLRGDAFFTRARRPWSEFYNRDRNQRKNVGLADQVKGGGGKPFAIVQYDDRPVCERDSAGIERNREYSKRHGYDHIFLKEGHADLPPYWRKVKAVNDAIVSDKYRGVLWLDTDAYIHNNDIELGSLLEDGRDIYIANDTTNNKFNAGVWLVRNTDVGKKIMTTWLSKYNPSAWKKKEDGKWTTDSRWSGIDYEQGAFEEGVMPHFSANIKQMERDYFNSLDKGAGTFIVHEYFREGKPFDELKNRG